MILVSINCSETISLTEWIPLDSKEMSNEAIHDFEHRNASVEIANSTTMNSNTHKRRRGSTHTFFSTKRKRVDSRPLDQKPVDKNPVGKSANDKKPHHK